MTLAISIHDTENLGDQVCCPADYFDLPGAVKHDAWEVNWAEDHECSMVIGGGGLVHGLLASCLGYVQRNAGRKLVAWGVGHNVHGQRHMDYGDALKGFDLVGIRDWNVHPEREWEFVPCVSCMSGLFDRVYAEPVHRHVVYSHHDRPVVLNNCSQPVLHWSNAQPKERFGKVLEFLASAEVVVTNTYHGAYWAMLLGRKVLVYEPFSSRFHAFKHQPPFVNADTWRFTPVEVAPAGYLEECRAANRAFYAKVRGVLGLGPANDTTLACQAESEVG